MKKSILFIATAALALGLFSGCGGADGAGGGTTAAESSSGGGSLRLETRASVSLGEPLTPAELPKAKSPVFVSTEYGYGILPPASWAGRYSVVMNSASDVELHQRASFNWEDGQLMGRLFSVNLMDLEAYTDTKSFEPGQFFSSGMAPWMHMFIGRGETYAFIADIPSDMQYDLTGPYADAVGREYSAMQNDLYTQNFRIYTLMATGAPAESTSVSWPPEAYTLQTVPPNTDTQAVEPLTPAELPPVYADVFANFAYGYIIEFPESWSYRYCVVATGGSTIELRQRASYKIADDEPKGKLCDITAMPLDAYAEFADMQPGQLFHIDGEKTYMLMGKTKTLAIVAGFPTDLQYETAYPDSEAVAKEYAFMQDDICSLRLKIHAASPLR